MKKEYVVLYSIFAHHKYKAITMTGANKKEVEKEFCKNHSISQYKIKTIELVKDDDFEAVRVWEA